MRRQVGHVDLAVQPLAEPLLQLLDVVAGMSRLARARSALARELGGNPFDESSDGANVVRLGHPEG